MRAKYLVLPLIAVLAAGCAGSRPEPGSIDDRPRETGVASYYAKKFEGRRTASGDRYDGDRLTAAHRTLPFGTRIRVTTTLASLARLVTVNDRGPFRKNRVIDVSRRAARTLGFITDGTALVAIEVVDD